jgi:NAD(P)-dependent dehydrogenase (short-subunit alcohol dehydrogenase family)
MRSVLITGTSSGIGLATTVVLASRGWRVFATMRNLKKKDLLDQSLSLYPNCNRLDLGSDW